MSKESPYYKEIIEKLSGLKKKEYALFVSIGIQSAFLTGLILFFFFSLLELAGHFSAGVRTYFFFFTLLVFIAALSLLFIIPLLKYSGIIGRTDFYSTAAQVGKSFPEIKDDLVNVMQLAASDSSGRIYSGSLSDAAFRQVYRKTKALNFNSIISYKKAKELLLYASGITLFAVLLLLFVPGLSEASGRIMNFNTEFVTPARFSFEIHPGNVQVTKALSDIRFLLRIAVFLANW